MPFGQRVTIVQRRLTDYRVQLFAKLRELLEQSGIELALLVGEGTVAERAKRDGGRIDWARTIPTRYWANGRLCWQPFGRELAGSDLVIIAQENRLLYNHWLLACPRRFKIAFWGHGANLLSNNPQSMRERFKRWTTNRVDWWFAYTQTSADLVAARGFPRERITNLENAIDTSGLRAELAVVTPDERRNFLASLGWQGARVGLFLGSLYPDKRLDFLFEAGDRLRSYDPDFRLLIVGDGPLRDFVRAACARRTWCAWVGAKTGHNKAVCLMSAAALLNPGVVGLSLLDSFAARAPMVTTDCDGHGPEIAYLCRDENGVMTSNDIDAYVAGVRGVFERSAYRSKLLEGCRMAAERYTIENMARNFSRGVVRCLESR